MSSTWCLVERRLLECVANLCCDFCAAIEPIENCLLVLSRHLEVESINERRQHLPSQILLCDQQVDANSKRTEQVKTGAKLVKLRCSFKNVCGQRSSQFMGGSDQALKELAMCSKGFHGLEERNLHSLHQRSLSIEFALRILTRVFHLRLPLRPWYVDSNDYAHRADQRLSQKAHVDFPSRRTCKPSAENNRAKEK